MATNRLAALETLVDQDPGNTFTRYALAMEYSRLGEFAQAVEHYQKVIETNPGYLAAYFHQGQALEKAGRIEEARGAYRLGIDAATRAGDFKTLSEIEGALEALG